jgi:hypothetical protein
MMVVTKTTEAWGTELKESLGATKLVTKANKTVEKRLVEEYKKQLRKLKTVKNVFKKQIKRGKNNLTESTNDSYVQKLGTIVSITSNHVEVHQAQCT